MRLILHWQNEWEKGNTGRPGRSRQELNEREHRAVSVETEELMQKLCAPLSPNLK